MATVDVDELELILQDEAQQILADEARISPAGSTAGDATLELISLSKDIKSEINTSDEKVINVYQCSKSSVFCPTQKTALWFENLKPDLSKSQVD